ncbi:MAG: DUF86 domain-containing protein [Bacteroidota bacterium]|nr:DUF86 domain-containing protein [Bacteroidota bacterium]
MQDKIGDEIRRKHILFAIQEIESYISGVDKESFVNNSMMLNATLRQLEIIGEASNKLSNEFFENHPNVPWSKIISLRNFIIHEYFGVDDYAIWNIITINIPLLKI